MNRALLLNATYEPLRVVSWQRAVTLWVKGKVEVLVTHDRLIRSVSISLQLPSVLRLYRSVRVSARLHRVPFSRANVYLRDRNCCQYCGRRFPVGDLTFDHVIPASQGGRKDWHNIVTCCIGCNRRKGGKTLEESGLRLIRPPSRPAFLPALRMSLGLTDVPEPWRDYLFWHTE